MFTIKKSANLFFVLFTFVFFVATAQAQTASVFATGFRSPTKIIYSARNDVFFVAEAGTPMMSNTGRISLVSSNGSVSSLIEGLPSGAAPPDNAASGPSALWLDGDILYIAIGSGNTDLPGPAPGSEIPNPNPASPLFSSVLELKLPAHSRIGKMSYHLQLADQTRLANGETVSLGFGTFRATLRLTVNFPDYRPEPRPDVPLNVRPSNPFGLVGAGSKLYVTDASLNQIRTVNLLTRQTGVLFDYPARINPLSPPPLIDAVPDSLRLFGNKLLVTFLTGFPFPAGLSDVRQIDLETGAESPLIGGLTTAIDVLPVSNGGFCHSFYTLELSTNLGGGAPGRLRRYDSPTATPTLISDTLISPTSLAQHLPSGDLLITEIFPGRITRISNP
ncbi:MAG: ScyD/ScyE family protein [Actinomycetota bacterium]